MTYTGMYDISLMHLIVIEFIMEIQCSPESFDTFTSHLNVNTHVFFLLNRESRKVTCSFLKKCAFD